MNAVYTYRCVNLANSVWNLRNTKKLRVFEIENCAIIFSFAGRLKIGICRFSRYGAKLIIKNIGYFNILSLPSSYDFGSTLQIVRLIPNGFPKFKHIFWTHWLCQLIIPYIFSWYLQYFRVLTKSFLVYLNVSYSTPLLILPWLSHTKNASRAALYLSLQKSFQPGTGLNTLAFVIVNSLVASWNACTSMS